jgi:hypothetical protein
MNPKQSSFIVHSNKKDIQITTKISKAKNKKYNPKTPKTKKKRTNTRNKR